MGLDALIIGASGQDGKLLEALLKSFGLDVRSVFRPGRMPDTQATDSSLEVDCLDENEFAMVVRNYRPKTIFHLGGVNPSSENKGKNIAIERSMYEAHVTVTLNAIKASLEYDSHLIVALSSKMFTNIENIDRIIDENSKANPDCFYGHTKLAAWNLIKYFREERSLRASGAILFNHVGYREASNFLVTRIVDYLIEYAQGGIEELNLLNWNERIDLSHPQDIVEGLFAVSKVEPSSDFVFGSGLVISPRDLVMKSLEELGFTNYSNRTRLVFPEPHPQKGALIANTAKALKILNWSPRSSMTNLIVHETQKRIN